MNNIRAIRLHLGLTQAALAAGMGVTQGNVSLYEHGQPPSLDAARRLIEFAAERGLRLTFDHIFGPDGGVSLPAVSMQRGAAHAG